MKTWKKIGLGGIAGSLVLGLAVCVVLLMGFASLVSDMCATTVFDQVTSPSGQLKAVVFQVDCGATTAFNSHVSIVPASTDVAQKDSLPQSFFATDSNNGQSPAGKNGGPEVRLHWLSDNRMELQHHTLARVIRAESASEGVAMSYKTFQ